MTYFTWRSCRAISRIIPYMASIGWGFLKKGEKWRWTRRFCVCVLALIFWLWSYVFTIWWFILNLPGVSLQLLQGQMLFTQRHLTFWHKKLPEFINCHLHEWWRIYPLLSFISYRYIKKRLIKYTNTKLWNSYTLSNCIEYFVYLWLIVKNQSCIYLWIPLNWQKLIWPNEWQYLP